MLTGSEIRDLSDAYNRLSRLAISLSQPTGVTPASALAVGGGRSHGSTYSARGRGMGRGTGGRGRFQCTYCGKIGHLEDRCWDKHGRPSLLSQGRNMVTKQGKSPAYLSMGSAQTATPTLEESSPSIASETVNIDKAEYEQFLAHKASQASASTAVTDRAFSAGPSASDSGTVIVIQSVNELASKFTAAKVLLRLVVIYFTAAWCGPCRMISPVYSELAKKHSQVAFLKVDIDQLREAAAEYNINSVPTFFFLRNGKELDKVVGADRRELERKLALHSGTA
ncbi:TPR repeat-containing thioredoxin [Nymphaea thermarum]|nr:TPR repeat-containing thioredoxin [Nymphaea thermarum]